MKLPTDPHDNPRLYLREYLEQNDDTLWTLLAFDKALVAKYPGITKKTAHAHVRDDMEVLKKLYPESTRIRHRITAIEKELKKKNDTISKFFTDLKPTFETAMLTKEVSQATLEAESLGLAASVVRDIRRKRDVDSSPIQTANKRHMAVAPNDSSGTATKNMAQCEEIDGIYVNASGPSVGTTIKREALYMNSQYKSGQKLTSRERKIMVAGMSSILDIADNSMESQRSLFSSSEWDLLSSYFNKKFRIKTNPLPVFLDDTWTILSKLPIETGKHYLYKALASSTLSKEDRNMLKIMEHCLDVMDDYAYLLTKAVVPRLYTEQDYFRILWSRLLELLFGTSKNVRIKAGESAPIYCTNNKAQLYPDQENIIGFKIDGRLIVDIGDNENDLAAIEVAKDDEDRKIIRDMGKLIREAKDDLDNLIQNIAGGKRDPSIFTWMLQIAGANCSISTIHLAGNGLYTTVYQHSFDLPLSVDAFPTFRNTLKFLLAMKEHITKTANKFVEVKSRRNSIRDNLGQFASESSDDEDYPWTRDTWYTPLRDDPKRSVIPDHMFGHSSKPLDRTLLVPEDSTITVEHVAMPSQLEGIDPFGFKKVESGWYNVHTGKTTEAHPLHSGDQSAV